MNPMDLRRGVTLATEKILAQLSKASRTINSKEEIQQVATISANGDSVVGKLIADALEKVGKDGVITVQEGKVLNDELDVVEGMKFDRGYVSPYFMTNIKTQKAEYDQPRILVVDGKISSFHALIPLLEAVLRQSIPLVLIAEDFEGDALGTLILNRARSGAKLVAVKAPGFGDNRKAILQDIATLTGATLVSDDLDFKLEKVGLEHLGTAKKISITKDDTLILNGGGSPEGIQERVALIRANIEQSTSTYDKEKLQERLAKLTGGVAVIKVGGSSEVEVGERKDRVDDALNATRAAIEEGIVPGGGMALLYASQSLVDVKGDNPDQTHGVTIVREAIRVPARTIASNAGLPGEVIIGKLLEKSNGDVKSPFGLDAQTGSYPINMIEKGIIDPTKVVRTALVDASGVASIMFTTEAMIVDLPKKDDGPPAGGAGMGGGMGGMDF
jgi:chaperonin GroEL